MLGVMEQNDPIRRGRHVVAHCQAHLVFVTKYRRGAFTENILTDCEEVMESVCEDFGVNLLEFNGEEDHVHLLVSFPPAVALSNLVNSLKGVSSRILRRDHHEHLERYLWGKHLWSRSYYVATTGGADTETVRQYIRSQRRSHH